VLIRDFDLPPITALPNFTVNAPSSVIYNLYGHTMIRHQNADATGISLIEIINNTRGGIEFKNWERS
jgi:hypothetical protein